MLKNHNDQQKTNSYWMQVISNYRQWGVDFDTDFEKTVQAQTTESVCQFVKLLLSAGNTAEVIMLPAE